MFSYLILSTARWRKKVLSFFHTWGNQDLEKLYKFSKTNTKLQGQDLKSDNHLGEMTVYLEEWHPLVPLNTHRYSAWCPLAGC